MLFSSHDYVMTTAELTAAITVFSRKRGMYRWILEYYGIF